MSIFKTAFNNRGIVLTAEKIEKGEKEGKKKSTDLVQIYLATIPSLQGASADLKELLEKIEDPALKKEAEGWVESIKDITVKILNKTIESVRGAGIVNDQAAAPQADLGAITPEMISGEAAPAPRPEV